MRTAESTAGVMGCTAAPRGGSSSSSSGGAGGAGGSLQNIVNVNLDANASAHLLSCNKIRGINCG